MDSEDSNWKEDDEEERWDEPTEPHLEGLRLGAWQDGGRVHSTAIVPADGKPNVPTAGTSTGSIMSRMALNDNKAGMDGLDKEKINKIILEASKGSRFYENERKKEAQVNQRIERMMQQLAGITGQQKAAALIEVDAMVAELEESRHFNRSIVHLDMDAFYAAVEMRDNPTLKDKPMAVGSMSMLSTSNYHARRFGVRAAMPGFIGKKLCPELIIVPTNFDKYRAVSKQVREILAQYDPNFCPMSLDEAYFDLTDHLEKRRGFTESERTFEYGGWNRGEGDIEPSSSVRNRDQDSNRGWCGCSSDGLPGNDDAHQQEVAEQGLTLLEDSVTKNRSSKVDVLPSSRNQSDLPTQGHTPCRCNNSTLDSLVRPQESSGGGKRDDSIESMGAAMARKSRTFGFTVEDVVEEIRFRIEQKTQLTASAGIAPNLMLAKICSDKNKPNGHYRIQPNHQAVIEFIRDLPIRKVSGIGKVTEKMLSALGIQNCTDLYQQRALLHLLFSSISSQHFLTISMGLGSTRVERDGERKSISTERTFHELHRPADLYSKCNELCQALEEDLQKEELMGKTVTIKIKTVKFEVKTRACSVPTCINTSESMFSVAKDLLRAEINACKPEPLRLRLMGVRLSNLQPCNALTNKQDSITKFFKKQQPTSTPQNPLHLEAQQVTSGSEEKCRSQNPTVMDLPPDSPQKSTRTDLQLEPERKFQPSTSKPQADAPCSPEDQRYPLEFLTRDDLKTDRNYGRDLTENRANQDLPVDETTTASSELLCPVCNIPQPGADLETFNAHVDLCLNRGAIRDMLKQQAYQDVPTSSRSSTSPTKGKRSLSGPKSAAKRRKQEKTQMNTLDKFFT